MNVWEKYFEWNFKGNFEIPYKQILAIHPDIKYYTKLKFEELFD